MSTLEKPAKAERIELRVSAPQKALLAAAAQSRHMTVSDFLLTHAIAAAEREVAAPPRIFYASAEGWAALHKLLDEAEGAVPAPETIAWITSHRRTP
jgi:uncharacterized protein (DUF1778 family)